jgi:hypothetical protein
MTVQRLHPAVLWAAAIVVGFGYALVLMGPHPFNPADLDWLKGDPVEHIIGWGIYAQTPGWSFPLTWSDRLGYPIGSYVSLTDPALPVFLGAVRHLIPAGWQLFGWLFAVNAVLLVVWGYRLTEALSPPGRIAPAVGALMLLLSPKFAVSAPGDYCGQYQWAIVAALFYLCREQAGGRAVARLAPLWALTAIAAALHPYVGAMVGLVAAAACLRLMVARLVSWPTGLALVAVVPLVYAAVLGAIGVLSVGGGATAGGFQDFSLNLLSPFDPGDFRTLIRWRLPVFPLQEEEGYAYLGLGLFALLALAAAGWRGRGWVSAKGAAIAALVAVCLIIAVSNRVTLGRHVVFEYPLPAPLAFLAGAFRAPGRFFWPVWDLLIVGAVAGVARYWPARWVPLLLIAGLAVQTADLEGLRRHFRHYIERPAVGVLREHEWRTARPGDAAVWSKLGAMVHHLVVLPAFQCDPVATPGGQQSYATFGRLAVEQGLTINSYRASRYAAASLAYHCRDLPDKVATGALESDTAYVLNDNVFLRMAMAGGAPGHRCERVDGVILCLPAAQGTADWRQVIDPVAPGATLGFGNGQAGSRLLLANWQPPEADWSWSAGPDATLVLPVATAGPIDLAFTLMPLLGPARDRQPVRLLAEGREIAAWTLEAGAEQRTWMAHIDNVPADGYLRLTLSVPAVASPVALGIPGHDGRSLGVALIRLRVLAP